MKETNDRLVKTSKFLSLVLRHEPDLIGIALDSSGWVLVSVLLKGCARQGYAISHSLLNEVVTTNDKKRFEFNEDGTKIRASQGHSVEVELGYKPLPPPDFLFHGTATRNLASIRKLGLIKGKRHHVHLSADRETATKVGQRYGKPVVLRVHTGKMAATGMQFFLSTNGVWLTDHVAPEYLEYPDDAPSCNTVTLYRPTGPVELALVKDSGFKRWPQRLAGQPIFYPVTNEEYAREIAQKWNVPASGKGYVTRFEVKKDFMDRYEIHQVGAKRHTEWWIPAEELEQLNDNIVGVIEIIAEFG